MSLKPIHDPALGTMRCVALMSGSGTNVRRILEHREKLIKNEGGSPFDVVGIFSDCWDSQANRIGMEYDIPVLTRDLVGWMKRNEVKRNELDKREKFDIENIEFIKNWDAKIAIYAGYMSIASPTLIDAFLGVNVHPADLSITGPDGRRVWTGAHAVRDAIEGGEKEIRSTTHLVTYEVDAGPILMVSGPVEVDLPEDFDPSDRDLLDEVADHNQERLKQSGDWVVFPRTIEALARGEFALDEEGRIHRNGVHVPGGMRLG